MKTVLLVDEEPGCLLTTRESLTSLGYKVIDERDARTALAVLKAGAAVDLVITECRFSEMDGLEFIGSCIRMAPAAPTIVLTGDGSIQAYLHALSLGVFEYVNKPVKTNVLQAIVKAALVRSEDRL